MTVVRWRTPNRTVTGAGRIAIIGGGFSGTTVLAHLAQAAPAGTDVVVFDARAVFGTGTAYGTHHACHLLNVQAGRMGAFEPDDFVRWLSGAEGRAAATRICPDRAIGSNEYLPRALYGAYLEHILDQARAVAARRGVTATLIPAAVDDVRARGQGFELYVRGAWEHFDVLVLATGNQAPRPPSFATGKLLRSEVYVADVWASGIPDRRLRKNSTVLILGTGLTAIDAILSLDAQGFKGRIVAVSRHGWLPAVHAAERPAPWSWVVDPRRVAPSAVAYLHWLKTEARLAEASGADWRGVFEALRPITTRLWRELDDDEQCKVLRRHSLWSVHRHRMAPEIADKIDTLRRAGRLEIAAARVVAAKRWFGRFHVRLRRRHATADETLRPALILNCTGPQYDLEKSDNPVLRRLAEREIIVRSPNGAGVAVAADGSVHNLVGGRVFALGPLAVGDQFETTAVPELRRAARWVAGQIAEQASLRRGLGIDQFPG